MRYYRHNNPYTPQEKLRALKLWAKNSTEFVCHRFHCSERSLWRWKRQYDGTLASLENGSCRPKSVHPRAQTDEEKRNIHNLLRRNPDISLNELYGKLRSRYGYTRHYVTLYKYLRSLGVYGSGKKRQTYVPKPYDTPVRIGEKMQLDVKYVPSECKAKCIPGYERFYQFTIIDEASRQRYIRAYRENIASNTIDFVSRAIEYFGYIPKIIQTDNGSEFTYTSQTRDGRTHPFDAFCISMGIVHKTIKPRTPRHNGKVERSHRNDNERFYKHLKFYSFEDLQRQMSSYLYRSNRIPSRSLTSADGTRSWLTPMQKREELLEDAG